MSKLVDATLIIQIFAASSAAISALAAVLIWRGNILSRRAIVQPRIFVHGSTRDARERLANRAHGLNANQIDIPGIFVENIGRGPAVKGIIYVIDSRGQERPIIEPHEEFSFLRIPEGNVYHYPSHDSPQLGEHVRGQTRIRIKVRYFDINNVSYDLDPSEENVLLFPE